MAWILRIARGLHGQLIVVLDRMWPKHRHLQYVVFMAEGRVSPRAPGGKSTHRLTHI